jgi:hypothetical protein
MPIFNWKGFHANRGVFLDGTVRAKDSKEAMDIVLKKRLGGSGEVTVWPKKKDDDGKTNPRSGAGVDVQRKPRRKRKKSKV